MVGYAEPVDWQDCSDPELMDAIGRQQVQAFEVGKAQVQDDHLGGFGGYGT